MKHLITLLIAIVLATASQAAALREAQFTRVINDVKKLPDQAPSQAAAVGDTISGKTAVSTGAKSRAELKFGDGTLTRLGANSIFSLDQGSRTIDLQQGTILLQVPKQMGGARVRTAAITAAVTGTTILVEYQPNGYVKVIVLEGSLDLFRNDKPSEFRTLGPGDMVLMKPDGKNIPEPVQVDLERLKQSSKLTNESEFQPLGNANQMQQAQQQQQQRKQDGELLKTALMLPGQGTRVTLTNEARQLLTPFFGAREGTPPPGPGAPGGPANGPRPDNNPNNPDQVHPPQIGGYAVLDDNGQIVTDPTITAEFDGTRGTGQGSIYRPVSEGSLGVYLFNKPTHRLGPTDNAPISKVDSLIRSNGPWSSFLVDDLAIIGQPQVDSIPGPRNLILASANNILLSNINPRNNARSSGTWNLDGAGSQLVSAPQELTGLVLAASGSIDWQTGFLMTGSDQDVLLYTQLENGVGGNVNITAFSGSAAVSIPDGSFNIAAGGDINITTEVGNPVPQSPAKPKPAKGAYVVTSPTIKAAEVKMAAGGTVNISEGARIAASKSLDITAELDLNVTSSAVLNRIVSSDLLSILLESNTGNVNIDGTLGVVTIDGQNVEVRTNGTLAGNVSINYANVTATELFKATTLSPNGEILIGNSTITAGLGIKLYAQGANGTVRFVGNSTLDGPATIAGNTVVVNSGVAVEVTRPNDLRVHSNNHQYNDGSHGNFTNGGSNVIFSPTDPRKQNFASRPRY